MQLWSISGYTAGIMQTVGSGTTCPDAVALWLKLRTLILGSIDSLDQDNRDTNP